jgi:hypothetical protein
MNTAYSYLIVDLMTEAVLAEVALSQVRLTKVLNGAGTIDATLVIDRDLVNRGLNPYDLTTPCRRCIYALRDGTPVWGGLIWTRAYDSGNHTVKLGGADFWSYYDHRKVVQALPAEPVPFDFVAHASSTSGLVDQNAIVRAFVQLGDLHTGGDINVQLDSSLSDVMRERHYEGYDLKDMGEGLRELANVINGPDIVFDVSANADGTVSRVLRVGTPKLGQQGDPHIWEYGGNIQHYAWPSDGSRMATRIYAVGNGMEKGTPIAVAEEQARYVNGWPLLEGESGYTTVSDTAVLQEHADADQVAARAPVVLPVLTVRGDLPPTFGTYGLGDEARVLIEDDFHVLGIDSLMRIVQLEISPGEVQGEQVKLVMAPLIDEVTY